MEPNEVIIMGWCLVIGGLTLMGIALWMLRNKSHTKFECEPINFKKEN